VPQVPGNQMGVLPVNQTVIDLVSKAVNPIALSSMDPLWMAYL